MGYGIQVEMLPLTDNGIVKTRNHLQWLEARKNIEKEPFGSSNSTANGVIIECPGLNDVLFNRGKSCQYHPGNVTFKGMLESRKDKHLISNQTAKKELAWEVIKKVEANNGRFLYWDKSGWWVEFRDRSEIRHKVATSLRDFNKQMRAKENLRTTKSSTLAFQGQDGKKRKRGIRSDERASSSLCNVFDCNPCTNSDNEALWSGC